MELIQRGDVCQGVKKYGAKEYLHLPFLSPRTPQRMPQGACRPSAYSEEDPLVEKFLSLNPYGFEARYAHNAEENKIVDIHKVPKGCDYYGMVTMLSE